MQFYLSHLYTLPFLSPLSSAFSSLSHITPWPLPFPKEVNKKLSYRGHNALSVIKTHERNNDSEHTLYLSARQSRLAGRIMFSTCPFVRPSVRLFVRLSVTNLWTLYFENRWTDFNANWCKSFINHKSFSRGKGIVGQSRGQEIKGQGHRRRKLCLETCQRHHSRVDRVIQSAMEMLTLKRGGVLHIVLTTSPTPPPFSYMRIADALVYISD